MNHTDNASDHCCIRCQKTLPAQASFCPWCEAEQLPEKKIKLPARRRRWFLTGSILIFALICVFAVHRLYHRPQSCSGGSSVNYPLGEDLCIVFLSFYEEAGVTGQSMDSQTDRLIAGNTSAALSRLFVSQEGSSDARERFLKQIEDVTVTAAARDGAATMDVLLQDNDEGAPGSPLRTAVVLYGPENGTNDIIWEIKMRNGDRIHLQHAITCELQPTAEYHYEEYGLETIEEIEEVLEQAILSEPEDTILQFFLPPVTYEGKLKLTQRSVSLFGSEKDGVRTTFADTVTVSTRNPQIAEFYDLSFAGQGGTGLLAREGIWLENCTFSGWDVGVSAENGSWVMLERCGFSQNGVGFRFDSHQASCSYQEYRELTFTENSIGVQLLHVPGDLPLSFIDCSFSGNEQDLEDPAGLAAVPESQP